jgi:hypothetical protein
VQRALEHAVNKVTSIEEVMRSMSGLEEPEGRSSLLDDVLSTETAKAGDGAARLTG